MKRVWLALKQDVRFQCRHGFYLAYLFVTLFYAALLSFLPDPSKPMLATMIIFSDPSFLGYFFIGGIILLEKGQGIIESLMVTPLRLREYLLAKAFSLPLLSVMSSLAIHMAVFGCLTVWFLLGIWCTSIFFTLFGLGVAIRCRTLGGYFLASSPAALNLFASRSGVSPYLGHPARFPVSRRCIAASDRIPLSPVGNG